METISKQFENISGVYSVTAPIEMTKTFVEIQQAVTKVGRGVVLVLMAVSIITVGTTIRLSVFARRREIEIMKYVGATNALVTLPFVIEGLTMGLLSGILTAAATIGGCLHRSAGAHAGRPVADAYGYGSGAAGKCLAHHPDLQPRERCSGGRSGQYVLHPQAPERVRRGLLCTTTSIPQALFCIIRPATQSRRAIRP